MYSLINFNTFVSPYNCPSRVGSILQLVDSPPAPEAEPGQPKDEADDGLDIVAVHGGSASPSTASASFKRLRGAAISDCGAVPSLADLRGQWVNCPES